MDFSEVFRGIIKPTSEVDVSVQIDGVVESIFVKEGDSVKKGDKLLKLDDTLQNLETQRRKIIWKDKSGLNFAIKSKKSLKELLNSTKELYNSTKSVSKNEVKTLEMKYYGLEGDIQTRVENEKKERVEYEISKALLSKYLLTSPIDGIITEITLQEGEWAKAGMVVIKIVNSLICYLDINIDEKFIHNLKVGDFISFNVETKNHKVNKEGKIIFISPMADTSSGLVRIKIEFDNKKDIITPGLSASIDISSLNKLSK